MSQIYLFILCADFALDASFYSKSTRVPGKLPTLNLVQKTIRIKHSFPEYG